MDTTIVLCDFAEAVNGKLYIMGGGWTRVGADLPFNAVLAIKVDVPWDQTNIEHSIQGNLVNEDGQPIYQSDGDHHVPVSLTGKFELGRPAGMRPGASLALPIVLQFQGLILPASPYRFDVFIDNEPSGQVSFETVVRTEAQQNG